MPGQSVPGPSAPVRFVLRQGPRVPGAQARSPPAQAESPPAQAESQPAQASGPARRSCRWSAARPRAVTMSCTEQLSRRDCTLVWLCYTTVVVNDALNDTELERLLAQLLRLVSPAVASGAGLAGPPDSAGTEDKVTAAGAGNGGYPGNVPDAGQAADGQLAVSASEARALIELVAARGIAQGELGSLLGLEKSTVSRLAAGLERKGWIRRGRDEGNQRYVRLYLTRDG